MNLSFEMQRAAKAETSANWQEAEAIYRQLVETHPDFAPAWHALGLLALNVGKLDVATQMVGHAVMADPNNPIYQRNMGEMCRRLGRLDQAILCGIASTKLSPKDVDAHYNLGLAYTDAKDYSHAIKAYRTALKLKPDHGLSWNNLGSAIEQQGDKNEALKAYARAVAINPQHAEAQNNLGAIYTEQGKLDEGRVCFQAAIDVKPDFVEAHYNLSSLKTYQPDDPHLAMLESIYASRMGLSDHARIRYCFALGKALDDIGSYDRAFAAYEEGNRLQHALLPTDEAKADAMVNAIIQVFDRDFFAKRQEWKGNDKSPIFIVGMPRSGTSLLEQILSSHGSVYGAGELVDLNEVISVLTGVNADQSFTQNVAGLSEADMRKLGEAYAKRVWKLSPKSQYITDKMPANFFYIGLIHLALPHAKIIHAMRDPMDSCFSCYSRLFNDTMEFAYDQGSLGRYYLRYMKLMQHWHSVLPTGSILDLRYEDMVEDTEAQSRRVLAFVGLPWDKNCLEFHKNDRLVKTASVAQVRKPIYKTSVARWKHFARHLRPLLALVKDYRPADDIPELAAEIESAMTPIHGENLIERCLDLQARNDHLALLALIDSLPKAEIHTQLWHLYGISLYKLNRFDEAKLGYERALALQPNFPGALNSYGFLLQDMGLMHEALAAFESAVKLAPEFSQARLNLGMAQLKLGDFESGWDNYEARWTGSAESANSAFGRLPCPLPQWGGEFNTSGQGLLVMTEQGFGDTFQFARYLSLVTQRFAKVGFVCTQPTARLLETSFSEKVIFFTHLPKDFATWDWQCSLMSLPRAFKTELATIPVTVPYFRVTRVAKSHWHARLENAAPNRFRVGVAWAGRKVHQYDARRSITFEQLLPLLHDPRVTWVSLQKWAPEEARPVIPDNVDWIDWTEDLIDFADTAALVDNLDLVISIDSSMVHLAGALNKSVWVMNRFDGEWRWLEHRLDSPWYRSVRLFNQPNFGDWSSVLSDVQQALATLPMPNTAAKNRPREVTQPAVTQVSPQAKTLGTSLSVVQAMQLASQHQSAGRLQEAEHLLRQILQVNPNDGHALHLLGVVAHQAGSPVLAIELIAKAIVAEPQVALFFSNLAEMNRQQGQLNQAIEYGRRAIELEPTMATAHSNLGIALYDAKDYDAAESSQQKALALAPNMLQSINNMGSIHRSRKDLVGAAAWYRRALEINPHYLESLSNLGAVLVEDDHTEEAVPYLDLALNLMPSYPEALCNLGLVRLKQEQLEDAAVLLERSLQIKKNYPEALIGLARVRHEQLLLPEAEAILRQVISISPDKTDAWCQLALVLMEQGDADEAELAYQQALSINPANADALAGLGNLRLEQGKIEEAEQLVKQAIAIEPDNLGARFHLTQVKKVKLGDENFAALESLLPEIDTMTDEKKISLHYALGKSYDDLKDYDKAFPHYMEGARIKRKKLHYNPSADTARSHRIIEVVNEEIVSTLRGMGDPSDVPVFVLGMPRSGTTLTEQIIASHPLVHGSGELYDLMEIVQQPMLGKHFESYPDNLIGLDRDTVTRWGQDYVARLRQRAPSAQRITDKMPANYLALGLIPLMMPNAKIIHVQRNPIDTCVSCFTRLFNRHQDATYDLSELGQHYANYVRLIEHWRTVLPKGSFMEVQYEDIVADMEGQARRLIEFCDLEWDDACLDFHKNTRSIRTASVTQVRQPIYTSSVERWRHYEQYLNPLFDVLSNIPLQ